MTSWWILSINLSRNIATTRKSNINLTLTKIKILTCSFRGSNKDLKIRKRLLRVWPGLKIGNWRKDSLFRDWRRKNLVLWRSSRTSPKILEPWKLVHLGFKYCQMKLEAVQIYWKITSGIKDCLVLQANSKIHLHKEIAITFLLSFSIKTRLKEEHR